MDFAAVAAGAGDKVNPSQIHHWVRRGLLPAARTTVRPDFAVGPVAEIDVERQLLALLEHRRATKSVRRLTLLMRLDEWPMEPDRLQGALRALLPRPPAKRLSEADRDQISRYAVEHALALRPQLAARRTQAE